MANEKRLISVEDTVRQLQHEIYWNDSTKTAIRAFLRTVPAVDAVEAPDKKMLKAIKMLIKQYEHSKQSDYVHNPIAHAFYHTWKQLDESGYGERKDNEKENRP